MKSLFSAQKGLDLHTGMGRRDTEAVRIRKAGRWLWRRRRQRARPLRGRAAAFRRPAPPPPVYEVSPLPRVPAPKCSNPILSHAQNESVSGGKQIRLEQVKANKKELRKTISILRSSF